jgi:S-formylglutathione hydrolase FrmB
MHTLTITSVEKKHSIPDGADFLEVSFAINDVQKAGKKKKKSAVEVYAGRHGFPLSATEEEITESMQRVLSTFIDDDTRKEANKEVESLNEQADGVIASLSGSVLT